MARQAIDGCAALTSRGNQSIFFRGDLSGSESHRRSALIGCGFNGDPANPATTSCPVTQFVDLPGQITAIEYYHDVFDNYFVTSLPAEVSALDQHRFQGWRRTDLHFAVHPLDQLAGSAIAWPSFQRSVVAPKSSHFFSPLASECAAVMQEPQWLFEGLVFGLTLPRCPR